MNIEQPVTPRPAMRAALVGCGAIAKMHVSALPRAGVDVVGVCDRDEQRAAQIAALAHGARLYGDLDALLAEERPDVLHVLTSPASHAQLAIKAAEAGVHALVEKPVALSTAEADAMMEAGRANGVHVMANHNWLFKPSVQRAWELVESGQIGDVVHVEAYYGLTDEAAQFAAAGGAHWAYRLPGGVFTNFLPHVVYLQDRFLGGIQSVQGVAVGGDPTADDPHSELTALIQGPRATGVMTISIRARPYTRYLKVFGTQGIVQADLVSEVTTIHRQRRLPRLVTKALFNLEIVPQLTAGTVANSAKVVTGSMRNMPDLHAFVEELYSALAEGREPPTSAQDGHTVVRVMEQVWERMPEAASKPAKPEPARRERPRTPVERKLAADGAIEGRRVLVTGAGGYLGRRVAAALVRCGADVRALVRDPQRVPRDVERDTEVVTANLVDADSLGAAMKNVDMVVHCAALTTNNAPWSLHTETNIEGTRAVYDRACEAGVKRMVHVSSVIVYGLEAQNGAPLAESAALPSDPDRWGYYQRSKLGAEQTLAGLNGHGPGVVIVRPGIIYGPGAEGPVKRGLVQLGTVRLTIGDGSNHLPLTYVDNVVDGILLALTSENAAGETYNLVDDPQPTIRSAALKAAEVQGEETKLVPVPPAMLSRLARMLERKREQAEVQTPPRLSRFQIASATRDVVYDAGKARRELGWEPQVSLDEGLRRTFG